MKQRGSDLSRRDFLATTTLGIGSAALASKTALLTMHEPASGTGNGAIAVSSENGLRAVELAVRNMNEGMRPVDAAVAGVNINELDPEDITVGYGGLPNEEGVVELDSSVMDGIEHKAGAVASLRGIKTPSKVALLVMRRSDHCLLVGEGALRFAVAHGFEPENLLTEKSRKLWLYWKETLSETDDWLPPTPEEIKNDPVLRERPTGTVHVGARNGSGDFGACTSTSGLAFKVPGRVGDSPLIGDGLYVDNDVGSAGSTGRGEAVILSCGSFAIVERMRASLSPVDACLDVLKRVAQHCRKNGLADSKGRPTFQLSFYAIAKDGRYGAASLWSGQTLAVADNAGPRVEKCAYLFERDSR